MLEYRSIRRASWWKSRRAACKVHAGLVCPFRRNLNHVIIRVEVRRPSCCGLGVCCRLRQLESDQTTSSAATGQVSSQTSQAAYRTSQQRLVESGSSLITLYANDPIASGFSVDDGSTAA